tara:strand:- start:194 stop:397 length:204 start_codon:yes stop_codon:yes gene_type:complete
MDFLKDLMKINNELYLEKIAKEKQLDIDEKIIFINKYNKSNNRLFKSHKKYTIDEYQKKINKYRVQN